MPVLSPRLGRPPGGGHDPIAVFSPEILPEERSLAGYSPWGCWESDMTEANLACKVGAEILSCRAE